MAAKHTPHLRLVTSEDTHAPIDPPPPVSAALRHQSRRGVAYYLHQGKTKTGAARFFFAKTIGEGALATMPAGYEVAESVNGVVSVRKVTASHAIPTADLELVRAAVAAHPHLRHCVVDIKGRAIIVHEPVGGQAGLVDPVAFARELGVSTSRLASVFDGMARGGRYTPVMMFELLGDGGEYMAARRRYSGDGGWTPLSPGPLAVIAKKYVRHIGKESFFELY